MEAHIKLAMIILLLITISAVLILIVSVFLLRTKVAQQVERAKIYKWN